jgi:hypothetical protein
MTRLRGNDANTICRYSQGQVNGTAPFQQVERTDKLVGGVC